MNIYILDVSGGKTSILNTHIDIFSINNGYTNIFSANIILEKYTSLSGVSYDLELDDGICNIVSTGADIFSVYSVCSGIKSFSGSNVIIWSDYSVYDDLNQGVLFNDNVLYSSSVICVYSARGYGDIELSIDVDLIVDSSSHEILSDDLSLNYCFIIDRNILFLSSDYDLDLFSIYSGISILKDNLRLNVYYDRFPADDSYIKIVDSNDIHIVRVEDIFHVFLSGSEVISNLNVISCIYNLKVDSGKIGVISPVIPSVFSVRNCKHHMIDTVYIASHMGNLDVSTNIITTLSENVIFNTIKIIADDAKIQIQSTSPFIRYTLSSDIDIKTRPRYIFLSLTYELVIDSVSSGISDTFININDAFHINIATNTCVCANTLVDLIFHLHISNSVVRIISKNITSISYLRDGILYTPITELDASIGVKSSIIDGVNINYNLKRIRCINKLLTRNINFKVRGDIIVSSSKSSIKSERINMHNQMPLYIADYN